MKKVLCGDTAASASELRKAFLQQVPAESASPPKTVGELHKTLICQLTVFSMIQIITASIAVAKESGVMRNIEIISLSVFLSTLPFGYYGALRRKGGALSFFVSYGLLVAASRTVLTVAGAIVVGMNCRFEQTSFKYCSDAALPCLHNSTCTRADLDHFNDLRNTNGCEAWAADECDSSLTTGSTGLGPVRILFTVITLATALVPVYVAYLFHIRFEIETALSQSKQPSASNPTAEMC